MFRQRHIQGYNSSTESLGCCEKPSPGGLNPVAISIGWQMFTPKSSLMLIESGINAGSLNSRKVQKVLVIEFEEVNVLVDKIAFRGGWEVAV